MNPKCDGCGITLDTELDTDGWPTNICYGCAWDKSCGSPLMQRSANVVRRRAKWLRKHKDMEHPWIKDPEWGLYPLDIYNEFELIEAFRDLMQKHDLTVTIEGKSSAKDNLRLGTPYGKMHVGRVVKTANGYREELILEDGVAKA